jgi:hypothetical protein
LDRSFSVIVFAPLLLLCSYLFYNSGNTTSVARPELIAALFAHIPHNKQFVKNAFVNAVPICLSKHVGNKSHPFVEKLLLELWGGVVEIESARNGRVPSRIEFDAYFANALLKFTKKNEVYLTGMKAEELSKFESAAKKFEDEGLEIAKCLLITAGEKVSLPAS